MPYNRSRQDNWWKRRTHLERQLTCIALAMMSLALILLVSLIFYRQYGTPKGVCLSTGCVQAASQILSKIDEQHDPCDDFYNFACGGFLKKTVIPDDLSAYSSFTEVRDEVQDQLRIILEEPPKSQEIHVIQAVKNFYNACMNEELINQEGLIEAQTLLNSLGGWPVVEEAWDPNSFDWIDELKIFKENGLDFNYLLSIKSGKDFKNSSVRIINIDQPHVFGLATHVLRRGIHDPIVKQYLELMVDFAVLFGANDFRASEELEAALNFEIQLAKATVLKYDNRNTSIYYNKMTILQLKQQYGTIDWMRLFANILPEDIKLYDEKEVLVEVPKYIDAFGKLLKTTSNRSLANYLFWRGVLEIRSFLPQRFEERMMKFIKVTTGITQSPPRWKTCLNVVTTHAPMMMSAAYIRRFFNNDIKAYAEEMVNYIIESFKNTIREESNWMDDETKAHALDKANKMIAHVAFAEQLLDDSILNDMFSTIIISEKAFLQSFLNINKYEWTRSLKKLLEPVERDDWRETRAPIVVNAYYYRLENAMVVPAAILQGAFFNKDRPSYLNYGGIGSIVGHEIVHAFDDVGSQFDGTGNMRNWWDKDTQDAFKQKSECFIEKFNNTIVEEIGEYINGVRTLGENIADSGGAKQAYLAYDSWTDNYGSEKKLPGLDYSPKQLFWISAAQTWCSRDRLQFLRHKTAIDTHSPNKFRVNVNFQNLAFFAKDFRCSLGSKMNPKKKCSVW